MNIKDIAQAAGVSIATVSRVTNGKPVKEATKEKVLRIMKEMHYVPNILARGLVASTTNTVGILISDISDIFFSKQLSVIEIELRKKGYNIIVVCIGDDTPEHMQKEQIQFLLGSHVAGIIFVGPKFQESSIQNYLQTVTEQLPFILLNDFTKVPGCYCIIADDFNAVNDVIKELHSRGRSHFLYLYDRVSPSGNAKLDGFKHGLASCSLPVEENRIVSCPRDITDAQNVVTTLLHSGIKIDAVIASQDELAISALKAALSTNLKIPEDIAIVGYNNSIFAVGSTPELSSIDNNIQMLSEIAIKTFFDVIEKNSVPNKIVVSCNFIERGTT